jgi:glycosyltransferase involved in cell wall biosynthesis
MRIAYISADRGVPIFGQKGCSIHAQEVLRALLRNGAQISVFSPRCEGVVAKDLAALQLHPLPLPTHVDVAAREQAALAVNSTLSAELERAEPFDLIYERYSLWSFAGMEFARESRVAGLLEVNAPLIQEQAAYRTLVNPTEAQAVAERVFGAASALLAVSNEVAAYLGHFAAAQGRVRVVPNGVRPERFPCDLKPALPASDGVFTVGFVGTLKAWHGLTILLEAFEQLYLQDPACRLLIVGHGPERDRLATQAVKLGFHQVVHFTGAVFPEEVPGLLASMDVAVAPYPKAGEFYFSPLKVYEYMAAGLAVVASRLGQLEKLVEPEITGLLVPPGDAPALAAALERLRHDPELRSLLGQAARSKVMRKHTWDQVAEEILRLGGLVGPPPELSQVNNAAAVI